MGLICAYPSLIAIMDVAMAKRMAVVSGDEGELAKSYGEIGGR